MASVLDNVQITLVTGIDDLMDMKRWLSERRETPLAIDTESEGLNPWKHKLRLAQIGDMHRAFVIPWDDWKGSVKEVVREFEGEWICHNATFEQRMFRVQGGFELPWDRLHDTLVQVKLREPHLAAGLKEASDRHIDRGASRLQHALSTGMAQQGWNWATVPLDFGPYWAYGGTDPILTAHLHHKFHPEVSTACPDAYSLEMATLRITTNMMVSGMLSDVSYINESITKFRDFSEASRAWLKKTFGVTSPASTVQLKKVFSELGCDPLSYTDKGAPQYNKENLLFYQNNASNPDARKLAEYVLAIRRAEKLTSTYLENFLDVRDDHDVIHTSINTMAARTGRMSSDSPSLLNLPKKDKVIRGSFIPRDGHKFITCDLAQIEARLGAHFSEDEGMIHSFNDADATGGDFFCGLASRLYGEPVAREGDSRRDRVKGVVYGALYSAGLDTMAHTAGVPVEQMRPVKEGFEREFPGLKQLTERVTRDSMRHKPPHITSPLGRMLVADYGSEYTQMLNALIQGHAAEYFKQRLVIIDSSGLGEYMRLPIHDECLLEVPEDMAEEALKTVADCMSDESAYRVAIHADGKVMDYRWQK